MYVSSSQHLHSLQLKTQDFRASGWLHSAPDLLRNHKQRIQKRNIKRKTKQKNKTADSTERGHISLLPTHSRCRATTGHPELIRASNSYCQAPAPRRLPGYPAHGHLPATSSLTPPELERHSLPLPHHRSWLPTLIHSQTQRPAAGKARC